MEIDTIIIGSGAGGLSSAICLSRAGQRVLVIEQHDVPGGWCHNFYLNGYRFNPGVHYIGSLGKGKSTSLLYEGLGIANDLVFFQMNPASYEHCWIGDDRIDMPAGFDELFLSLSQRFPKEKKGLAKYLTTVRNVSSQLHLIPQMSGFWDNVTIAWRTRHLGKYGLFSLKRVIDWHIKDPLLKKILNVQCGDHGLSPAKASFPLHCAVMDHYAGGGFYPMGGGGAIVKAMTKAIKNNGSEVRTSQKVKRILLEGTKQKRAVGVELENGEKIYSKRIISNADPNTTYLNLVGKDNLSPKLSKKLAKTKYSCTSLMLFLTVDMDVRKAGLDSGNIWMMTDKDTDDLFEEMMKIDIASGDEFPGLFISCTTLKDPTSFDGRYHVLEVVTFINRESFGQFKEKENQRSQKYLEFKETLSKKIINGLEKVLPGISGKIVLQELGTPLTNEFYVNSTEGNVYGTEKSFKQTGPFAFKAESEIENLHLCGASIMAHGVAGATYSGVQAAANILNCKQDELIKADESQHVRIYNAEDSSEYPEWMLQKMKIKRSRMKHQMH
ncbi:NAD(P)/FAD-dependent oxidoreductase [Flammeovirgaceae bacterium SG7u.111]|nr:NAD(P)/FAD-dependent oxidoreductase [Flammeovirgaceae bacterium SG7u.132]WPO38324.1 NAD(P)/FAD-dependent oxidoreductase [Flammeovirgaceae bacterium SG7u.111]